MVSFACRLHCILKLTNIVAELIVVWILEVHIHSFGCLGVKGVVAKTFDFVLRVVSLCRVQIAEEFSLLVVHMVACARRCAILGNLSKIIKYLRILHSNRYHICKNSSNFLMIVIHTSQLIVEQVAKI